MPGRQTTNDRDMPPFIGPHMIMKRIRTHCGAPERITVRKSGSHYYNISIRTRTVKRELKARTTGGDAAAPVSSGKGREKT
jgi:hypothetical protein